MTTNKAGEQTCLYRFRTVENLLGKRQELQKQQIYFASPDQLNDPLEGHINLYWKGDAIIWKNFFRNYLACTLYAFALWTVHKREHAITWQDIPVQNPYLVRRSATHDDSAGTSGSGPRAAACAAAVRLFFIGISMIFSPHDMPRPQNHG